MKVGGTAYYRHTLLAAGVGPCGEKTRSTGGFSVLGKSLFNQCSLGIQLI